MRKLTEMRDGNKQMNAKNATMKNMICLNTQIKPTRSSRTEKDCDARSRLDYIVYARYSNLTPTTQNTLAGASNADDTARATWKIPIPA